MGNVEAAGVDVELAGELARDGAARLRGDVPRCPVADHRDLGRLGAQPTTPQAMRSPALPVFIVLVVAAGEFAVY